MHRSISILLIFLFVACSSTPPVDLTDVRAYLYPDRKVISSTDQKDIFSYEERLKALKVAKDSGSNLIFLVVVDKEGNIVKCRLVKKGKGLDLSVVSHYRMQLKNDKFPPDIIVRDGRLLNGADRATAFYFPIRIEQEVEIVDY